MYGKRLAAAVACLAVGAAVFVAGMAPAFAEAPDRVPRIMMVWRSATPLNWEAEESVALVVGQFFAFDSMPTALLAPGVIEQTLRLNRPDLNDGEIASLSARLTDAFQRKTFIGIAGQVNLVTATGVERPYVYFDNQTPLLPGTMAQAGPEGDILVLGTFYFRQKIWADGLVPPYYLLDVPDGTWLVLNPDTLSATSRAEVAIGWFNK